MTNEITPGEKAILDELGKIGTTLSKISPSLETVIHGGEKIILSSEPEHRQGLQIQEKS